MAGAEAPKAGMTISIRTRRDVVVVDPDRFLAAAWQALRDRNPGLTDAEAAEAVVDVHDAVHALLDRDGTLAADAGQGSAVDTRPAPLATRPARLMALLSCWPVPTVW
ncbi:hypothetical protein [Micromonospora sp. NPDC048830]|uniref:hypothetical protein n=1 Tax=Micromonospora sp. NPDC048830 TaxID=3364257 RepID=UPI00371AD74E